MRRRLFFFSIHILLPLLVGGLVYICWRDPNLLMFRWFRAAGVEPLIAWLRAGAASTLPPSFPHWLIYSVPDGLWVYALTSFMILLWRDTDSLAVKIFWLSLGLVLGAGSELGQLAGILPGAFDPIDLVICLVAPGAALLFTSRKVLKRSLNEIS